MPTILDRPRSAEDTITAIKPWLVKAGVTRLADVTGMDRIGIPVYASIRPDSLSLSVDSGKGTTKAQAKCSAAMESLERWAGDEIEIAKFRRTAADAITTFPLNRGASISPTQAYDLTYAVDLLTDQTKVVPYYVAKMYVEGVPLNERCWVATTNGLSAGSTREDAITSGLYEVIERDAVTISICAAMQHDIPTRRVDLDKACNPECLELVEMIRSCGARVFVYDCTSEFGVPAYVCVIAEPEKGLGLHRGAGCHVNGDVAMARAICEAAQTRCILMAGARDDITVARHRRIMGVTQDFEWAKMLDAEPFGQESVVHSEESALNALVRHGIYPLVVDYPIEENPPFSVVKILAPTLEGYQTPYVELGDRFKRYVEKNSSLRRA
jgi:ribosomal protein S12 methylthiotransferase accessory factor